MDITNAHPETSTAGSDQQGFNVLDVALILSRAWRSIAAWTIALACVGAAVTFAMKTEYTASATFLSEPDQSNSGGFFGSRNDPTVAMLESNSVADIALARSNYVGFGVKEELPQDPLARRDALRALIRSGSNSTKSTDGVYTLKKADVNPERAVAVVNAYVDGLQDLGDRMSFETAARSRSFYQKEMDDEKLELEKAEAHLKVEQQRTGILQPVIGRMEGLRAEIQALQVQRAQVAQSATNENPNMVRLNAQIGALEGQISQMQGKTGSQNGDVPTENLELTRLQREVLHHQTLYATDLAQFERARLQESFGNARVRVIDHAGMPAIKTWPKRFLMTLFSGILGFMIGIVMAGVRHLGRKLRKDPESVQKLSEINQAFFRAK